jgi:radical SAM-linked protein
MSAQGSFRYRIRFAKSAPLRFIGHLDLHRTWERTLRRAGAPLAYTEGYNPRPRLNLGLALPLGCTSEGDLLDVLLESQWGPDALCVALQRAAPPGLIVEAVSPLDPGAPNLQREISACEYRVALPTGVDVAALEKMIQRLLAAETLPRERRGKGYDLRPLVESLALEPDQAEGERGGPGERPGGGIGRASVIMRLAAREGATGRPEEVLLELGVDPLMVVPHRIRLVGPAS